MLMNEVEKMYKNIEVEPIKLFSSRYCINEEAIIYPPFTDEKQIKLIKLIICKLEQECGLDPYCQLKTQYDGWGFHYKETNYIGYKTFEESIAGIVNLLIEENVLTEVNKQQIKEILNGSKS